MSETYSVINTRTWFREATITQEQLDMILSPVTISVDLGSANGDETVICLRHGEEISFLSPKEFADLHIGVWSVEEGEGDES